MDGSEAAYVTGRSHSSDFPITPGVFDMSYNSDGDVFVSKLNAAGSGLMYATFLGGSAQDEGTGIAVDGRGAAYVSGGTLSSDFPTTPGAFDTSYNRGFDGFVAKLDPAGSGLAYATYLSGSGNYWGEGGIAVDGNGTTYVTGRTDSSDFPTTPNAFDTSYNGGGDAVVARLNALGSALIYATFLGGSSNDGDQGIAVDGNSTAYVSGQTTSSDFPTTPGAFDTSINGGNDLFVAKLAMGGPAIYSVSGHVADAGGAPIPGVTVSAAGGYSAVTDATGAYAITGLIAGSYTLTAAKANYRFAPSSRNVTLPPDATGQDFVGTPLYSISGHVADAGGTPIPGVTVSAPGGYSAVTDATGAYAITRLIAGSYTLTAAKANYRFAPASRNVTLPPDATGQDFVGTPLYSISGHVADAGGTPIPGVTVSAPGGFSAITDATGAYSLTGLVAGSYTLTASKANYASPRPAAT